ncbi:MAG: helix-turn-helix domain-containing protein, partial [Acholeplasmataceae bacterium]|nr:helix-turn-helix domain-containing protein [Acholeplasmataceae bacterium]
LRKSKKMSRKKLSKGIISERTLQRIENASSRIDIVSLEGLLQRLNVQIDEYCQYQNQYQPSKKEIYRREFRSKMYQSKEISAFVDLMKKEYEDTSDIFYLFMIIQSKSVVSRAT